MKLARLRILIADDHEVVREGLRVLIEREPGWEVCAIAKTGREALEEARHHRPDVAVLDITMPELNGIETARRIRRALPQTEVVIFTARDSEELIREVFEAGARSYILKAEATEHLVAALKSLAQHKPYFTNKVSEILFQRFFSEGNSSKSERLTTREQEILRLLAEGNSNKEVATKLGISVRTAEVHRAAILCKPGIGSLAGLVKYALRHGIIDA